MGAKYGVVYEQFVRTDLKAEVLNQVTVGRVKPNSYSDWLLATH